LTKKTTTFNSNHTMKKSDFESQIAMRLLCQSLYNGLRLARKLCMDLDIDKASKANTVIYKGILQTLNTMIDQLKFED